MKSTFRTAILLSLLTALLLVIGSIIGGRQGMIIFFVIALVFNFVSYWFSDRIVLSMYRAKEVGEDDYPQLIRTVRKLTQVAGLPMPKVCIVSNPTPNAFATGRDPEHSAVAVTTGLIDLLSWDEIEGVLAHELSHIKNRDTLVQTVAATLAGAVMMLASMARIAAIFGIGGRDDNRDGGIIGLLAVAIVAPLAAVIIQLAISRGREYLADESGAKMCGNPRYLAGALEKLGGYRATRQTEANPATAHLFIVNNFSRAGLRGALFSTHPPVEERVKRLNDMAGLPTGR